MFIYQNYSKLILVLPSVEAPDREQETKLSCAGEAGSDRPVEAPDWRKVKKPSEVKQVRLPGQGGGRVQGEEGQVSRLPPEPPDQEFPGVQEGILASIPMKDGGQVRQQGAQGRGRVGQRVAHVQGEVTLVAKEGTLVNVLVGVLIGVLVGMLVGIPAKDGERGGHLPNGEPVVDLAGFTYKPRPTQVGSIQA